MSAALEIRPTPRPETPEKKRRKKATARRLIVVGFVLAGAIGFLLYKGLTSAIVYFKTANQALADRATLGNGVFQLEGLVMPHTLHSVGRTEQQFKISSSRAVIEVDNTGTPPALFQPDIPVVVVGHFVGTTNLFSSNEILVKHSNSYIAAHPNRVRAPNGSIR